jgi:hypothetical protein
VEGLHQQLLGWERQKRCYGRKSQGLMAKNIALIVFLMKTFFEERG